MKALLVLYTFSSLSSLVEFGTLRLIIITQSHVGSMDYFIRTPNHLYLHLHPQIPTGLLLAPLFDLCHCPSLLADDDDDDDDGLVLF